MTRIFTDGAEMGDTAFWDYTNGITISSTTKRSGNFSYLTATDSLHGYKTITPISEFYARFAFYISYLPGAGGSINYDLFRWYSNGTYLGGIRTTSNRIIYAIVNNAIVATGETIFPLSTWNMIEVHVVISDSGTIQLKFDGILDINFSGNTKVSSYTTANIIKYGYTQNNYHFDDLALNDTNGTEDNSWCGDGAVYIITPSGSGTTNDWLNSGSTSGSSNYTYVDNFPYDSGSYVYTSGSLSGTQDQYKMTPFTVPYKNIRRIFPEARAKKSIADTTTIKLGYFPSGGTDQISGSLALTTSYTRIVGNDAIVNPVTSASWTKADIDALEFIVEI